MKRVPQESYDTSTVMHYERSMDDELHRHVKIIYESGNKYDGWLLKGKKHGGGTYDVGENLRFVTNYQHGKMVNVMSVECSYFRSGVSAVNCFRCWRGLFDGPALASGFPGSDNRCWLQLWRRGKLVWSFPRWIYEFRSEKDWVYRRCHLIGSKLPPKTEKRPNRPA